MDPESSYRYILKQKKFRRLEKLFRVIQTILLFILILSFLVYVVFFALDICLYSSNLTHLFFVLVLDFLGLAFIGIGIRAVALEMVGIVIAFTAALVIVAIGHLVTFTFRHLVLNSCNVALDIVLALSAIYFSYLICHFNKCKPPGYDRRLSKLGLRQKMYRESLGQQAKQQQGGGGIGGGKNLLERKLSYDSDSSTEQYKEKPILASMATTLGDAGLDPGNQPKVPLLDASALEPTLAIINDENGMIGRVRMAMEATADGSETVKSFTSSSNSSRAIKTASRTTIVEHKSVVSG